MLFEYISLIFGIFKIIVYKIIYPKRITYNNIPRVNSSLKIAIKKGSKLKLGKSFRSRNNVSIRIYNNGLVNIGNNCFFNDGCSVNCQENIEIGNNTIFGQNVMIFDHDHDYKHNINDFVRKKVKIGNNVWIGANCVILKGVTIGDNVVIAAGTIISKDIPSNTLSLCKKKNEIISYGQKKDFKNKNIQKGERFYER